MTEPQQSNNMNVDQPKNHWWLLVAIATVGISSYVAAVFPFNAFRWEAAFIAGLATCIITARYNPARWYRRMAAFFGTISTASALPIGFQAYFNTKQGISGQLEFGTNAFVPLGFLLAACVYGYFDLVSSSSSTRNRKESIRLTTRFPIIAIMASMALNLVAVFLWVDRGRSNSANRGELVGPSIETLGGGGNLLNTGRNEFESGGDQVFGIKITYSAGVIEDEAYPDIDLKRKLNASTEIRSGLELEVAAHKEDAINRATVNSQNQNAPTKEREKAARAIENIRKLNDTSYLLHCLITHQIDRGKEMAEENPDYLKLCREIASLSYLRDDIAEAESQIRFLLKINPDDLFAINFLGNIYTHRGDYDAAEAQYLLILDRTTDAVDRSVGYGNLGNIYQLRGNLDLAEEMHLKAINICGRLNKRRRAATHQRNLGHVMFARGEFDLAERQYNDSLAIFNQLEDQIGIADCYDSLGSVYFQRGKYDKAESSYQRAIALNKQLERPLAKASNYGNLGGVYLARGDLDQAERNFREAQTLMEKLGYGIGLAGAYGNLGIVYKERGEFDGAETMQRRLLDIAENLGLRHTEANGNLNLGIVYYRRGDLSQAEQLFRKALKIGETVNARLVQAAAYGNLGNLYDKRDNLDKAEIMLNKSLSLNKQMKQLKGIATQHHNLGNIYRRRGNFDQARISYQQSLDIFIELGDQTMIRKIESRIYSLNNSKYFYQSVSVFLFVIFCFVAWSRSYASAKPAR